MRGCTVILLGSNGLLWVGLRATLRAVRGVRLLADMVEPYRVIEQAGLLCPDVILIEWEWMRRSPTELLCSLRQSSPASRIIVIGAHFEANDLLMLAAAGVEGYLLWKDMDEHTLCRCLDALARGELVVASRTVVTGIIEEQQTRPRRTERSLQLTARERVVLNGLAEGLTQQQIAVAGHFSVRTVKRTIASLGQKLEAPSTFMLGARARDLGLIPAGPYHHPFRLA